MGHNILSRVRSRNGDFNKHQTPLFRDQNKGLMGHNILSTRLTTNRSSDENTKSSFRYSRKRLMGHNILTMGTLLLSFSATLPPALSFDLQ